MPQSLSEIIAEARGNISSASKTPKRTREATVSDVLAEARENIARALEAQTKLTPRFMPQDPEELSVTRVIDGDTIEVDGIGPVRLTGLHAPETKHPTKGVQPLGPEASQLASIMFLGKKVKVTPQAGDERDVYGRMLATVTLPDGRIANASLAEAAARFPASSGQHIRDARAALKSGMSAGILRGLIYPVGSLVPELYDELTQEISTARQELYNFMQQPQVFEAMGRPSDTIQQVLSGAPSMVGEVIGGMAPGLGLFKVGQSVFKVSKAVTMGDRTARHMAATTASGAGFGLAARLEDGESRFSRVARDAIIAGAAETVFLPLLRRGWREEFGKHADDVVNELALRSGTSTAEAERKITAVRSGAAVENFEAAEDIVQATKTIPEIKGSPTHVQATKALSLLDSVLPQDPAVVDPHLPKEIALAFSLDVNGQRMPVRLASRSASTPDKILEDIDGVIRSVVQEMSVGRPVKIYAPIVRDLRTWEFFKNRLLNRGIRKPPAGKPLGAAPPGSVADTGVLPQPGDAVNVVEDTGQRVRGQVVEVGEAPKTEDLVIHKSSMPATVGRLEAAGFTGEEIRSMPELDLHVAAVLATPGKEVRQHVTLREARERLRQGASLSAPDDLEKFVHFTPAEATREGLDFKEYVTALTQHVLTGGKLSPRQASSFPYLAQLSRRVDSLSGEPVEVPVDLGRVKLPVVDPESGEVSGIREATRRTTPEEGTIFHFEGGETTESIRHRATLEATQANIAKIKTDLAKETDPARRMTLESMLRKDEGELERLARPAPERKPGRVKKLTFGHLVVRGPDGKESIKHASQVTVDVPIKPGEVLPRTRFVAHPDGGDRHALVHLQTGEVSVEPVGANLLPGESFFRSPLFTSVDPERDFGRDIPLFMHSDGSATLSITPVQEVITEKQASFGRRYEFGPLDLISAGREKQVGGVRRSGGEVLGLVEGQPPEFGNFPAGYVPRATRQPIEVDVRTRPVGVRRAPEGEFPDVLNLPRARENPDIALDFDAGESFLLEGAEPTVRVRGRRRPGSLPIEPGELRGMEVRTGLPVKRRPSEGPLEYSLTRESLTGQNIHPEWVTVRNTARVLMKQGYDPTAQLRVRIAREAHRGAPDAPTVMSIEEAANLKFPLPNSDRLRDEAAMRGITVLPRSTGSELHFPDGSKRVFKDDLEAMEAVMRIPVSKLDRPLEARLQREWNMGLENGIDPEVDSASFLPVQLQELLLNQLSKGGRPLAVVRTRDINEFNSAFDILASGAKKKLQVQTLEEMTDGSVRLAVFDPDLVRARASQNAEALTRLGVDPNRDPRLLVQDLDGLPRGTHIMEGKDVESSIMYSWYRQHSMKGNWEKGHVMLDETGPHRVFDDEVKSTFTFRVCE